jgi:hypothetical protein
MVIHKTMVVNKWHGKSQWKLTNFPSLQPIIGGNRWNIGSTTVFSLNKGGNMLPTSFDNSLPKEGMSVHGYLSPTMQCFLDQPLCKTLKWFSRIWFFLRANLLSIIWRQQNDLQWPIEKHSKSFGMPCRIMIELNGNGLLDRDFKEASDVASHDVLNESDSTFGGGGSKTLL